MFKLFLANLKMMVRGRQSLFWSLAFPLMFTVIFGFFFGSGNMTAGKVALINQSNTDLAKTFVENIKKSDLFNINDTISEDDAKNEMKKSQLGAIIVIPKDFGRNLPEAPRQMKVIVDPANQQVNGVVEGYINQYLTTINFQIAKAQPVFSITEEKTTNSDLTYFDFVLIGLIGLALMNGSVQGIAITMSNYREDKILKRITTTPLPSWKFVSAEVLARLVLNLVQITLILGVGHFAFNAHIFGNLFLLYAISLLGGLLFQTIGFMVASIAKTTDAAQGMAVFITIPMMFLAGVFFPIDQLPKWLYSIVQFLPLAPLLRMIRQIGLESLSPLTNPINILIVLGWIVVMLVVTIWRFRLSDE